MYILNTSCICELICICFFYLFIYIYLYIHIWSSYLSPNDVAESEICHSHFPCEFCPLATSTTICVHLKLECAIGHLVNGKRKASYEPGRQQCFSGWHIGNVLNVCVPLPTSHTLFMYDVSIFLQIYVYIVFFIWTIVWWYKYTPSLGIVCVRLHVFCSRCVGTLLESQKVRHVSTCFLVGLVMSWVILSTPGRIPIKIEPKNHSVWLIGHPYHTL